MKIALLSSSPVPPSFGGMNRLLDGLTAALRRRHPTDLIVHPCDERDRDGVMRGYYDFYHLDLSACDLLISYKAPAFMARHPAHVHYLSHRMRVFYDLFDEQEYKDEEMRRLVRFMDDWALDKARIPWLFTVGETVSRRLKRWGGHDSIPLHHPSTLAPAPPRRGEYFFSSGRLHPLKRVDLVIRAFRRSRADCPLVISGSGPDEARLREFAAGDPRIEFVGHVGDERLAELYAGALAAIFPPLNEDMGLITFESFASGKPVLTAEDAGEPPLIVRPGETGFIAAPEPEALAERIDWMWEHRDEVEAMAPACMARAAEVTWDRVATTLIEAGLKTRESRERKNAIAGGMDSETSAPSVVEGNGARREQPWRLLVTDNQIIDPPVGGGRVRIFELYRHLPEDFTTTYIGAFDYPGPAFRDRQLTPNFREILTPLTAIHFKAHHLTNRLARGKATVDVTMPSLVRFTPRYRRLIERHLPESDFLICSHPWMFGALPTDGAVPCIYDSHNCEAAVKAPLLKGSLMGRRLAANVRRTERRAVERSRLILACSDEDAAAFEELYGADRSKILLVPNGVDCSTLRPAAPDEAARLKSELNLPDRPLAVFTGSNYVPNFEAARFIVDVLAPALPQVQFGVIGGVQVMFEEAKAKSAFPPNVVFFGFVERDRMIALYRAADLALNPMSQGSGTNIKMLDYMAAGLPIVTTARGARGLTGRAGEHWIETPLEQMIEQTRALLENPESRRRLGEQARRLAQSHYDWSAIAATLAEALRAMAHEPEQATTIK